MKPGDTVVIVKHRNPSMIGVTGIITRMEKKTAYVAIMLGEPPVKIPVANLERV